MNDKLLSPLELSKRIGMHPSTIRRLANDGKIPFIKIGTSYKFNLDDVLAQCGVKKLK